MKNSLFKKVFLGFTVYCSLFTVMSCLLNAEPLAENQARFGQVAGDVGVLTPGAAEWKLPVENMPIDPGDQIRTAEGATVELVLSEAMLVVLGGQSEAVAETTRQNSGRFNLRQGSLTGRLDSERARGPQQWEFHTPVSVCGVRGTEFALDYTAAEGASLGVFEGEVDVRAAEGPEGTPPSERVRAMEEVRLRRGQPLERRPRMGPLMERRYRERQSLRRRQARAQGIWTPWTDAVRREHRLRYALPPKAPVRRNAPPARRNRPKRPN